MLTQPRWIVVAATPTIIWMLRLERWTRRPPGQPRRVQLPHAHALPARAGNPGSGARL